MLNYTDMARSCIHRKKTKIEKGVSRSRVGRHIGRHVRLTRASFPLPSWAATLIFIFPHSLHIAISTILSSLQHWLCVHTA